VGLTTAQKRALAISKGRQFENTVMNLCHLAGAKKWQHQRPGLTASGRWMTAISGDKGAPDLQIVTRTGKYLLRELKSGHGKLSPEQKEWMAELVAAGVDAAVWMEADVDSGRVWEELTA
jgi:hypothetical protein